MAEALSQSTPEEGQRLLAAFLRITSARRRAEVIDLAETLAGIRSRDEAGPPDRNGHRPPDGT